MKAIVLAGGFAKRLWPLTKNIPKPLLDIGGKPIIDYIIKQLISIKSIETIYVSTNKKFKNHFFSWLKTMDNNNIEIVVEPTYKEEEKFGAVKGIYFVLQEKQIYDDILIVAGDNIFEFKLLELINFFKTKKAPVIALYDLKDIELAKQMGVVEIDNTSKIIDFVEKPEKPKSTLIAICCYVFPKDIVNIISKYINENNNPDSPGYFIAWLVKKTPCFGYKISGKWFDIGTPESLKKARKYFSK